MVVAIFALAGTLLGVLGTIGVELARTRAGDVRARREAVLLACADFTTAVTRVRNLAVELTRNPTDAGRLSLMREAHIEARVHYERLRLITASNDVQKAGRYVLRYTYGLVRLVDGKPPRDDEQGPGGIFIIFHNYLMDLYKAVRNEIGVPHPDDVYREPDEWIDPYPRA
jgi:hypothetical protein